eukprot:m.11708 g.11708  ORF g.11708 m.11708 type:complete len:72 (+) comp23549_c0_seq2:156-371(+)
MTVLKKSETQAAIQKMYEDTKGEGPKKQDKRLQDNVSGHNQIQEKLNSMKAKQTTQPKICSKRTPHPFKKS